MKLLLRAAIAIGVTLAASHCGGQTATAQDPERASALTLEAQGNIPEAEAAWQVVLKAHPEAAEAYAHLGLLEARQANFKEALPNYRKALALAPAMPGLRLNLGLALFKAGDFKETILTFQPMLKEQPADSDEAQRLNILMGMAHYGCGEYAEAVPYLKKATSRDAQNLPLRLVLAHSCLWSKEYQCVLNVDHEILALNAESAEADMLAGEAEDELKNRPGAIEQFRNAVKANPKEPNVHFGLGYLLWTQRQYVEAIDEFQAEIANDPGNVQALLYQGDAELQLNRGDLARPLLEKAATLKGDSSLAHLDMGILDSEAGRKEDALREFTQAAKLAPEDTNVHWHLGRLYLILGKKDLAKAEFNKVSALHKAENDALLNKLPPDAQHPSSPPQAP